LAFDNSDRIQCVCVYDPQAERARAAADSTGARIAATAEDVDIVAVLTPAPTHADLVEVGASAGKHFMLEKPIATTLNDARRICRAINEAGVACYHPTLRALGRDLFAKLRELTSPDGELGAVRCGFFNVLGVPFPWAQWFADRSKCLPAAEYGSHVFDTFLALTHDEPTSVWCHSNRYFSDFDQDDVTTIQVRFQGGRYFQMNVNWMVSPECNVNSHDFRLVCERGVITHNWFAAEWTSCNGSGEYASPCATTQGERWNHYEALVSAIEKNEKPTPNETDGLDYLRIVDAAVQSSPSEQWIAVEKVSGT
jgi:predicted dehydrogenase